MSKKIIVVDDSRTARVQVRNALAQTGFEIVEAVDGLDGIAKISEHPDAAVVLCDVNMPNMNGLEMLTALKEQNKGGGMAFLMLTTEAEASLIQRAKAAGVKGWIVKPFKPQLLVAAVTRLVEGAGAREQVATAVL
jgi:two-component system, chemotaxis family, chemotaxis protein CheY